MARVVDHCLCFNSFWIITSKQELNKKNHQNQANLLPFPTISKVLTVTHGWPWTFTGFPTCQAKCQGDSSLSRDHFTSVIVGSVGHRFQEQFLSVFLKGAGCVHIHMNMNDWKYVHKYVHIYIYILSTLYVSVFQLSKRTCLVESSGMHRSCHPWSQEVRRTRSTTSITQINRHVTSNTSRSSIWVFPKIGVPQNGWFIMENPIKIGWFGGTTIFGNIHIKAKRNIDFSWNRSIYIWPQLSWPMLYIAKMKQHIVTLSNKKTTLDSLLMGEYDRHRIGRYFTQKNTIILNAKRKKKTRATNEVAKWFRSTMVPSSRQSVFLQAMPCSHA